MYIDVLVPLVLSLLYNYITSQNYKTLQKIIRYEREREREKNSKIRSDMTKYKKNEVKTLVP